MHGAENDMKHFKSLWEHFLYTRPKYSHDDTKQLSQTYRSTLQVIVA